MARGNRVELATRLFANQSEASVFFKAMLNKYKPNARVSDGDSLELAALLSPSAEPELAQQFWGRR